MVLVLKKVAVQLKREKILSLLVHVSFSVLLSCLKEKFTPCKV